MDIAGYLKELGRALRRLAPEQGPRARRFARARVRASARQLLAAMDRTFPPPPRKTGERGAPLSRRSPGIVARMMRARGLGEIDMSSSIADRKMRTLAAAGIRVTAIKNGGTWAPAWAAEAVDEKPDDVAWLASLKRNRSKRKAFVVAHALAE